MSELSGEDIDRIIEMAWEDRTPFDAILHQFGLSEKEVITLMRKQLKRRSWEKWRKRVQGRITKHSKLRATDADRFKSSRQRSILQNQITKSK